MYDVILAFPPPSQLIIQIVFTLISCLCCRYYCGHKTRAITLIYWLAGLACPALLPCWSWHRTAGAPDSQMSWHSLLKLPPRPAARPPSLQPAGPTSLLADCTADWLEWLELLSSPLRLIWSVCRCSITASRYSEILRKLPPVSTPLQRMGLIGNNHRQYLAVRPRYRYWFLQHL